MDAMSTNAAMLSHGGKDAKQLKLDIGIMALANMERPPAVQKADGLWPGMPERVWPAPLPKSRTFLNDFSMVDNENGLWCWYGRSKNSGAWYCNRESHNAKSRAHHAANMESDNAKRDEYDRRVEQETGQRRESRGPKWNDPAVKEMLEQSSVESITMPGEKVPPGPHEALMVETRDDVMTRLAEVMGEPCRAFKMEHNGKHSISMTSLLAACDEDEDYFYADSEYNAKKGLSRMECTHQVALARYNWNGERLWEQVWENDGLPLTDAQWCDMISTIQMVCEGKLICGWSSPELAIFAKAGRDDGIDALQAILKRMPHLQNSKTDGVKIGKDKHGKGLGKRDPTKRFSMAMDFLSNVFGIRNHACHTALEDCDGEAIVMSAFI